MDHYVFRDKCEVAELADGYGMSLRDELAWRSCEWVIVMVVDCAVEISRLRVGWHVGGDHAAGESPLRVGDCAGGERRGICAVNRADRPEIVHKKFPARADHDKTSR